MKKKEYRAYLTVEASFIIPIAFLLIVLTIQYGFFCYEKSVSVQCCYLAALRASNEWERTGAALEQYAEKEADRLSEERNLYPVRKEIKAEVSPVEVEVKIEGDMKVFFRETKKEAADGWEVDADKSASRTIPSQYIRKYQMIRDAGGGNDGNYQ